MKAEERKEIETNSLARWLNEVWSGGQRKKSYTFYAIVICVVVAAIVGFNWWSSSRKHNLADRWVNLDFADTKQKLQEIEEKYRGTLVGRDAKIRLARIALGPEGLDKLGTSTPTDRKKAVESIQEGRTLYLSVAPDLKDDPVLAQEAWIGAARAEESLIGVPKAEGSNETLGNIDRVIEYYEKARQIAGDGELGAGLQKKIDDLKSSKEKLTTFYQDVNRQLALPTLPPLPPLPPFPKE
jgi:hypothetical protein